MLYQKSRYSATPVITPRYDDGETPRLLAGRVMPRTPGVFAHTVSDGERLDYLAQRFYGESGRYWLILDANPEVLNPFHLLVPGRPVAIPRNRVVR